MCARIALWGFSFILAISTIYYSVDHRSSSNKIDLYSVTKGLPAARAPIYRTEETGSEYVEPDYRELEREHKKRMRTLEAFESPFTINGRSLFTDCEYYPHECRDGIRLPYINCVADPDICRKVVDRLLEIDKIEKLVRELRLHTPPQSVMLNHVDSVRRTRLAYRNAFSDMCMLWNIKPKWRLRTIPFVRYNVSEVVYQWTPHNQCKTFLPAIDRHIEYDHLVLRLFMFYKGEFTQCDSFRHVYYWKHADLIDNRCRPLMWHALGYNDLNDATELYKHVAYTVYIKGGGWGPELVAMGSGKLLIDQLEYDLRGKRPPHLVYPWDRTPLYKPRSRYSMPTSVARDLYVSLKGFTDELRFYALTSDRAVFWINNTTMFVQPDGQTRVEYLYQHRENIIWAPLCRGTNCTT